MKIRAVLMLAVAGLVFGTACTPAPRSGSAPDVVIVGFGDSIVYGSNYAKPWLYLLLDRLTSGTITYTPKWPWVWDAPSTRHDRWYQAENVRIHNSGIDGNTTRQMLSRFEEDVVSVSPDYCMVLGGANDIFRDVSPAETEANLTQLYERCENVGVTPVACTLTPVKPGPLIGGDAQADDLNSAIDALNRWILSYCSAHDIAVVDFSAAVRANPSAYLQPDGLHPAESGHDAMARSIDVGLFDLAEKAP